MSIDIYILFQNVTSIFGLHNILGEIIFFLFRIQSWFLTKTNKKTYQSSVSILRSHMFLQILKMVAQSIASTSSPQRETQIRAWRVFKLNLLRKWLLIALCLEYLLSQIAILDGMSIFFLPKLHKFRPICVPFQITITYVPSLKYRFVLTPHIEVFP